MCGLIAALTDNFDIAENLQPALDRMQRRGPDDAGVWQGDGVCLGHRRLAIVDLDGRSAQPMHSTCDRYAIVYNGEIYNFKELRGELERGGTVLRTASDTEVLVELFAREGAAMLPRLRGMFAFVIWDKLARTAFAARDPYGVKPLYLAETGDGWIFASQVKALLHTGMVSDAVDPNGQAGFWLFGSVPDPHTWYSAIQSVPAGHWCRITADRTLEGPHPWFDIGDCWRQAPACTTTAAEAQQKLRTAVLESVRKHLVADVPVGVFLSGGIDSGSLAGLIRDAGGTNIQGITIAFREFTGTPQDETPIAARIARQYGIQHHVRTVTRNEFEADLPRIFDAMDQPSIDGINTWYAGKAVAELGLKVVISGVGGDELLCGYSSFRQLPALVTRWNRWSRLPGVHALAGMFANRMAQRSGNPRWHWLTRQADSLYGAYWMRRGLFSPDQLPALLGGPLDPSWLPATDPAALVQAVAGDLPGDALAAIGQLESKFYLGNQLLRDSDWASMDHSVELRTPLVDAWLLDELSPLLRGFGRLHGKALLARSPTIPLPDSVISRRKTGFGIPVERWLRESTQDGTMEGGSRGWAKAVARSWSVSGG